MHNLLVRFTTCPPSAVGAQADISEPRVQQLHKHFNAARINPSAPTAPATPTWSTLGNPQ